MVKRRKAQWELRVRGTQREPLEADLLAQVVVMLGRQLSQETMTGEAESDSGVQPVAEDRP
jgi:hypothetical protein